MAAWHQRKRISKSEKNAPASAWRKIEIINAASDISENVKQRNLARGIGIKTSVAQCRRRSFMVI